jgi:hypothetical protein
MRVSRGSTEIRRNQGTRLNLIGVEEMLRRESGHDGVRLWACRKFQEFTAR